MIFSFGCETCKIDEIKTKYHFLQKSLHGVMILFSFFSSNELTHNGREFWLVNYKLVTNSQLLHNKFEFGSRKKWIRSIDCSWLEVAKNWFELWVCHAIFYSIDVLKHYPDMESSNDNNQRAFFERIKNRAYFELMEWNQQETGKFMINKWPFKTWQS